MNPENLLLLIKFIWKFDKIPMDANNQMWRFGFGKNNGDWFARIDLGSVGFRISRKQKYWTEEEQGEFVETSRRKCGGGYVSTSEFVEYPKRPE